MGIVNLTYSGTSLAIFEHVDRHIQRESLMTGRGREGMLLANSAGGVKLTMPAVATGFFAKILDEGGAIAKFPSPRP
jgi:hypothetical protein